MDMIKLSRRPKKLKGFTLLEMIVVIAIIGVLASIIVPNTVSQMRDARIEQANAKAKQVYQAVQDYCTQAQIKKVPLTAKEGESAAFPYTTPTGTPKKFIIQFVGTKSSAYDSAYEIIVGDRLKDETSGASTDIPDAKWGIVNVSAKPKEGTGDSSLVSLSGNGIGKERAVRALTGITNSLGASMGATQVGSFIAQIDAETYTVDFVGYSEEASSMVDVQSLFGGKGFYTQIFGHAVTGRSQEEDTNEGTYKYIGQYPI